ncbi:HAD hydrolase-like protein [Streptomyces sp. N2-109]|uniref:HAD hydrolase-like protein n=1 Tax=Streptomyces gossypii TaxID=2883101 RepID=A0ABT2JUS3_9ACTN|nr:HAD hydrolase-like protein [Streptomyces gossypii]
MAVCDRLSISPADCTYIGDSPLDIECAQAAGARAVWASWGCVDPIDLNSAATHLEHPRDLIASPSTKNTATQREPSRPGVRPGRARGGSR